MRTPIIRKLSLLLFLTLIIVSLNQISSQATPSKLGEFEPLNIIKTHSAVRPLKQGEKVNITLEIRNDSESYLQNLTFSDVYSNDTFRVLRSTASVENSSIVYDYTQNTTVSYTWESLDSGEEVFFWTELQVTGNKTIDYSIKATEISYQDEYRVYFTQESNKLILPISGDPIKSVQVPLRTVKHDPVITGLLLFLPVCLLIFFGLLFRKF